MFTAIDRPHLKSETFPSRIVLAMRIVLGLYLCRVREVALLAGLLLGLVSCAHNKSTKKIPSNVKPAPLPASVAAPVGSVERGIASWYGEPYHGRRAANGEVYDMNELTAAHRTLPFGTWVRVLHLANQKKVEVRITDRGPFVDRRIIDLSRKAAQAISLIGPGTGLVEVTVIHPPKGAVIELYGVQAAAYAEREKALVLRARVEKIVGEARLMTPDERSPLYRVLSGATTKEGASEILQRLRQAGLGGYVVRLDSTAIPAMKVPW